jgi:WD40-like Beta Propeller Repeat
VANLWKRAAVAAVAIVVLTLWSRSPAQDSPHAPLTRLEIDLGDSLMRSTQVGSSSAIISPDGSRLVFVSFRNQEPRLMT